jgi:serine/threonine protein kinase
MSLAPTAAPRVLVGTVLARRWKVLRRLGEGGMGEVFAAEAVDGQGPETSKSGAARVALKVLRPEFVGDGHVRSRFLDEARMCMRLVHPNIVRVLECAQADDGTPFLVMELLDGVPLGAYTQNGGRVPLAQAVPILQGILAGLAAAHALGIVHRDLKPDNVLLTREAGGTFVVKVLDFGIAKVMDVAGGMGFRTRTGMLLGTPAYMSPEQAKSARDVDQRADLWSAGVLFYEMLTGTLAFPAPTEFARLAALMSLEPEPIERIDPALAPLAPFIARALKKDRNERFASAHEMAHGLAAAVPHLGVRPSAAPRPLNRLPDVASILVLSPPPGSLTPPAAASAGSPTAPAVALPARPPGDTLASLAGPTVTEAPLLVEVMSGSTSPLGETLPSTGAKAHSYAPRGRGVAPVLVVVLVVGALIAGFLLGWAASAFLSAPH